MLAERLRSIRVLPVLTVHTEEQAIDMVRALSAGGLHAVEITLRSSAAQAAIRAVKKMLPEITVAAGTVRSIADMEAITDAGADFAVSPGFSTKLSACARSLNMDFLPGVSTPSEIIAGTESGHHLFKLFPAQAVGGLTLLKALACPFADIHFCPTGGISAENFKDYLALSNVICVGGSWMIDPELVRLRRWEQIEQLARHCSGSI